MSNDRKGSAPRCWWCKARIPLEADSRGVDPLMGLPPMVGVVVCSPACPKRPDGVTVHKHPNWRTR